MNKSVIAWNTSPPKGANRRSLREKSKKTKESSEEMVPRAPSRYRFGLPIYSKNWCPMTQLGPFLIHYKFEIVTQSPLQAAFPELPKPGKKVNAAHQNPYEPKR